MEDLRGITEQELKDFTLKHFQSIDFGYWNERLAQINRRLIKLKSPKKRNYQLIDLFAVYIQITEIAHITMMILTQRHKKVIANMFVGNAELRKFIKTDCSERNFYDWFLRNYGLNSSGLRDKPDYEQMIKQNIDFLSEAANDYLDSYNYLNAFKHGFRVNSTYGGAELLVNNHRIIGADTSLSYLYKEFDKEKGAQIVKERDIIFNYERVLSLVWAELILIDNAQQVYIATELGRKIGKRLSWVYVKDREGWSGSFGKANITKNLFVIPSKK